MSESTLLSQIGEANKSFVTGKPRLLEPSGEPFVVVACIDPRLTGFLEPALGLPRNRAVVIRIAGNQLSEKHRDALRSVAVALFVKKAGEIFIVGHTDCNLANFSTNEVVERFRQSAIPRTAFGEEDLRTWFGALSGIRDNVISSIDYLRRSGIVPGSVKIHGLILDTGTGAVEIVVNGDLVPAGAPLPALTPAHEEQPGAQEKEAAEISAEAAALKEPPPPPPPRPAQASHARGPVVIGKQGGRKAAEEEAPDSLLEAALELRNFFHRERQSQQLQRAVLTLQTIWRQEKSPYRVLAELRRIVKAYETQYPNLPAALAYVEKAVKTGSADKIGFGELMRRIF
jgi:carbonic anhydrase